MMTTGATVRRNRIMLIVLFAITLVPLFGAYWLYESFRAAKPWGTTNRGELLDPIVSVADLKMSAVDGKTSMISGRWWLVVVESDGCPSDCQTAVHQLHQLHILLGRDATRVRRALVAVGAAPLDESVPRNYPELVLFNAPADALRPGVYIVDPLGNVVLRYEYANADKAVLEDIRQLLKVSHIG
jgi:cytochrome oxidase Cu insertion factor (SCO1/SenC/PrrC family)